jgi:hypothetical protein
MRCIINVSIGGNHPKEQERLRASLEGRFHGATLMWSEFPNKKYNQENPYNAKAAAFEEAILQGYEQILWLDSPVVAMRDVAPVFEKIEREGYLTVQNYNRNCAESCSDACLEYFKLTRDQAEKIHERASGIIGVNMKNKRAAEMIYMFIRASKDGACDGSRNHDGQSKDPRFKFHRQDQSVLSLCAHSVGLHTNDAWDIGQITLYPDKRTEKTVFCWTHRGQHTLPIGAEGSTPKQTHIGESFIYVNSIGGFNDALNDLGTCTQYAITHKYSIIWNLHTYAATDLTKIFDTSKYPVPIYLNAKEKIKELKSAPLEPSIYKTIVQFKRAALDARVQRKQLKSFNIHNVYPREKILLYSRKGGGLYMLAFNTFKNFRFTPEFIEAYHRAVKSADIPKLYSSIHLRATDRDLKFYSHGTRMATRKIRERNKPTNTNISAMKKIDIYIDEHAPQPVYVATDNKRLLHTLKKKHPSILHTTVIGKHDTTRKYKQLHNFGKRDPNNLRNALIDLCILAGGEDFLQTAGGFSRLASQLHKHKSDLHAMLSIS